MRTKITCKQCGKQFIPFGNAKYCSFDCRKKVLIENQRKRENTISLDKTCKHCNKTFTTTYSKQVFCSANCRKGYYLGKLEFGHRSFRIFERDNFTCTYCGKTSIEDNIKLQIDHVYPLNKGGDNSEFNLITSCSYCNHSKSNIILDEKVIMKIWKKNIEKIKTYKELVSLLEQE